MIRATADANGPLFTLNASVSGTVVYLDNWAIGDLAEGDTSRRKRAQLEKLSLAPWASRRRQELLELLDRMNPTIEELTAAVEREARKRPEAMRLMTHPGVGPLTALAYVLIIGTPTRFQRGKQIGTYVGMIPCEASSARKQRLGHISKQGNSLCFFLTSPFIERTGSWQTELVSCCHGPHRCPPSICGDLQDLG